MGQRSIANTYIDANRQTDRQTISKCPLTSRRKDELSHKLLRFRRPTTDLEKENAQTLPMRRIIQGERNHVTRRQCEAALCMKSGVTWGPDLVKQLVEKADEAGRRWQAACEEQMRCNEEAEWQGNKKGRMMSE